MTELTNDLQKTPQVSAPQGLRGRVMAGLTFHPDAGPTKPTWRIYANVAGTLAIVVLTAAVVSPVFMRAKESAHTMPTHSLAPALAKKMVSRDYNDTYPVQGGRDKSSNYDTMQPMTKPDLAESSAPKPVSANAPAAQPSASANLMIIKTAELSVQVKDFQQANDDAVSIAKSAGGYVTDTSSASDKGIPTSGCLTMRVPAEAFERTLNRLTRIGRVTSRSISGEDVTGESVDLESRLRNLRAEERQYLDIMNRAKRIPDVVTVTNELSRVRGEIEEAQGRLKYLRSAAAMSTIDLTLSEKQKSQPRKSSIESTFGNAIGSLGATLSGLASIAIWLLVYSPFWALPIALWLYYRRRTAAVQQ